MKRFKFQGGRLMKAGDGRSGDGWFPTEEEAREYARPKPRAEMMAERTVTMTLPEFSEKILAPAVQELGRHINHVDWNRKWMAVKSDLKAMGFEGSTKAEAIEWAKARGVEVPA